jgi:hypothetical protein
MSRNGANLHIEPLMLARTTVRNSRKEFPFRHSRRQRLLNRDPTIQVTPGKNFVAGEGNRISSLGK